MSEMYLLLKLSFNIMAINIKRICHVFACYIIEVLFVYLIIIAAVLRRGTGKRNAHLNMFTDLH